jgi:hypothetical protein
MPREATRNEIRAARWPDAAGCGRCRTAVGALPILFP